MVSDIYCPCNQLNMHRRMRCQCWNSFHQTNTDWRNKIMLQGQDGGKRKSRKSCCTRCVILLAPIVQLKEKKLFNLCNMFLYYSPIQCIHFIICLIGSSTYLFFDIVISSGQTIWPHMFIQIITPIMIRIIKNDSNISYE